MNEDKHSVLYRFVFRFLFRFLFRTGHLFVENPAVLIVFIVRFIGSFRYLIVELSESRTGALYIVWRNIKQTGRSFFRGIVPVLLAGLLLGYLIHSIASHLGGTLHLLFDSLLMEHILRDLLPLAIALIVAGRAGSSIAGKFAVAPAMRIRQGDSTSHEEFRWTDRDIFTQVLPRVTATCVTAGLFYGVLVLCVLTGYAPSDVRGAPPDLKGAFMYASLPRYTAYIEGGAWRAVVCGLIIGMVASAIGIRASEDFTSRTAQMFELHNASWESIITSLTLCLGLLGSSLIATTP